VGVGGLKEPEDQGGQWRARVGSRCQPPWFELNVEPPGCFVHIATTMPIASALALKNNHLWKFCSGVGIFNWRGDVSVFLLRSCVARSFACRKLAAAAQSAKQRRTTQNCRAAAALCLRCCAAGSLTTTPNWALGAARGARGPFVANDH
jgi:hypothetical protein